jgi:hypothetical protein
VFPVGLGQASGPFEDGVVEGGLADVAQGGGAPDRADLLWVESEGGGGAAA